jgi:thiosulfate/3-mercaptopyruvate sulfurtransferase
VRYQFVDCRWTLGEPGAGRELYLQGHIPGASYLDVDADLSAPPGARGRHPLPAAEDFAEAAGRAGIGDGVFVIAYGNAGGPERLWWLLRHFGHDDCAVLDFESWRGPLSTGQEKIERVDFVPYERDDDTITREELAARLDDPRLLILDARVPERYRGEPNPIDRIPGHIPGAQNAPFTGALPPEAVEADEVVVYCGSGVTACVQLLALARAGRPDAKLYPGSWSEWEQSCLPVERP